MARFPVQEWILDGRLPGHMNKLFYDKKIIILIFFRQGIKSSVKIIPFLLILSNFRLYIIFYFMF